MSSPYEMSIFSCLSHKRPEEASVETYKYNKLDEIQGAAQYKDMEVNEYQKNKIKIQVISWVF